MDLMPALATTVCVSFPVAEIKYLTKQLKEGGFVLTHSLSMWSITVGEAWQKESEAACHSATEVRKQVNDGAQHAFFLLFSLQPRPWDGSATFKQSPAPSV